MTGNCPPTAEQQTTAPKVAVGPSNQSIRFRGGWNNGAVPIDDDDADLAGPTREKLQHEAHRLEHAKQRRRGNWFPQ